MDLFPFGTLSSGSANGTIDGVSYSFFEPNVRCTSVDTYTSLVTRFQNQTILARQKANPYLIITYEYNNIYQQEYNQIAHFISNKNESVNSFYVVNLDEGIVPSSIDTSSTWTPAINNTRLFSATSNTKSNYVFFYNGINFKIGTITAVTTNTSLTCNVDTNNYGTLSDSDGATVSGSRLTMIYPIYEVYLNPNSLGSFQRGDYWPQTPNKGFLHSGSLSFVSKYKI